MITPRSPRTPFNDKLNRNKKKQIIANIIISITFSYNLRPRSHCFSLTVKTDDRNYINRMLFKDIYKLGSIDCMVAFCQSVLLKRDDDDDDDDDDKKETDG